MERKMSAVLVADMVAFSRLMELEEIETFERQKSHLNEVFYPEISSHKGRIVKTTGDGILAEFPSIVEAVSCSVDIQRQMEKREAQTPEEHRIAYRVGINLGDVIHDEGDIFGDGVNIAARLEQLAEPGGICISGSAYDHLRNIVEAGYQDLGEVQVKNISRPVRAWRVLLNPDQVGHVIPGPAEKRPAETQGTLSDLERQYGSLANALDSLTETNRDQLEAIATRFEIANVFGLTDRKLRAEIFLKADDFRRYRIQIENIDERSVELSKIKVAATRAAEQMDFEEVENLLSQVLVTELGVAAETAELRAQNALLRGKIDQAFVLLSSTADSFAAVDPLEPVRRRLEYEVALCQHGERYGSHALAYSEKMTRTAISELNESEPLLLWRATIGLGISLSSQGNLAEGSEGIQLLEEAATQDRTALTILSDESYPIQMATTRNNLATTLSKLARRNGDPYRTELLEEAIGCLREALKAHTRAAFPLKWAMAQDNLGNALALLGRHMCGPQGYGFIEKAHRAHTAALQVRTRDDYPMNWALTQENIGVNWTHMAEHGSCPDPSGVRLKAESHLRDALMFFDVNKMPLNHAKAHANIGVLLKNSADDPSCADPVTKRQAALEHFEIAQEIFSEMKAMHFLRLATADVDRLRDKLQ